jgi:hypothetical protein
MFKKYYLLKMWNVRVENLVYFNYILTLYVVKKKKKSIFTKIKNKSFERKILFGYFNRMSYF